MANHAQRKAAAPATAATGGGANSVAHLLARPTAITPVAFRDKDNDTNDN